MQLLFSLFLFVLSILDHVLGASRPDSPLPVHRTYARDTLDPHRDFQECRYDPSAEQTSNKNTTLILIARETLDTVKFDLMPRIVREGCQIRNEERSRWCKPQECGESVLSMCIKVEARCSHGGTFFKHQVWDICSGCSCRSWDSPARVRARIEGYPPNTELKPARKYPDRKKDRREPRHKTAEESVTPDSGRKEDAPSPEQRLSRRRVYDGCQIQNPKGRPTCKPRECGQHPSIICLKHTNKCGDWGSFDRPELQHICQGCSCRIHKDTTRALDVYPTSLSPPLWKPSTLGRSSKESGASSSERSRKKSLTKRSLPVLSSKSTLVRRTVTDGCQIQKVTRDSTNCKPQECGQHPSVECSKAAGTKCTDSGSFRRYDVEHICQGCACRDSRSKYKPRIIEAYPPFPLQKRASPVSAEPGYRHAERFAAALDEAIKLTKNSPTSLERRTVQPKCQVQNTFNIQTCRPSECGKHRGVWCGRAANGLCTDGGTFARPEVQQICNGCRCSSAPSIYSGLVRFVRLKTQVGGKRKEHPTEPEHSKMEQRSPG